MYHERILTDRLDRLFSVFPVVVISGARQTGKSTFLSNTLGQSPYLRMIMQSPGILNMKYN